MLESTYGYCPVCKARGKSRERRPNGNDTCENGHIYPSKSSLSFADFITEKKVEESS